MTSSGLIVYKLDICYEMNDVVYMYMKTHVNEQCE